MLLVGVGLIRADFIVFSGADPNAGPGQPRPNSDAEAARFDAAAAGINLLNLIDFENAPLGDFSSLLIAPGVTVRKAGSGPGGGVVTTPSIEQGYNTTPGGERFLRGTPAGLGVATGPS